MEKLAKKKNLLEVPNLIETMDEHQSKPQIILIYMIDLQEILA